MSFTFIDLFAGIGGMRQGFEKAGGKCVFTSEWDTYAQLTYAANFDGNIAGDITKVREWEIPEHDVLVAGFPCQPFSIAGVSKHNALGRDHGFSHRTQGTLFFDVARIIGFWRPAAFLLENVKNLTTHDRGKTYATIMDVLQNELGYRVYPAILDAASVLPQHRERIYLVGFREPVPFAMPSLPRKRPTFGSLLEPEPDPKYVLTEHLWAYLQQYKEGHRARGNGFGFDLVDPSDPHVTTRTLSARYHKDGSEILISRGEGEIPRRLTPRECARLMGFPDSFTIPVSDTRAYRQFGNSVAVPVVARVAREIARCLKQSKLATSGRHPGQFPLGLCEDEQVYDAHFSDGDIPISSPIHGAPAGTRG